MLGVYFQENKPDLERHLLWITSPYIPPEHKLFLSSKWFGAILASLDGSEEFRILRLRLWDPLLDSPT